MFIKYFMMTLLIKPLTQSQINQNTYCVYSNIFESTFKQNLQIYRTYLKYN